MRVLELLELQVAEGPCLECLQSGAPVVDVELGRSSTRWPRFAADALSAGFRSTSALPMRLRGEAIGALNLFRREVAPLSHDDLAVAQAFADVATIAILQSRAASEASRLNENLTVALNSRIVIEQAKGMLAERTGVDMVEAFERLRRHARNHNLRLADLARSVIEGTVSEADLDRP
jgi:GAF domain-containing protein